MRLVDGKAAAYVCTGHECKAPAVDPRRMLELLGAAGSAAAE
jgi:uncharacterized protein YyaL (SSP411 family)